MTREEQMKRLQAFLDEWLLDRQLPLASQLQTSNFKLQTPQLPNLQPTNPHTFTLSHSHTFTPREIVLLPPVDEVASSRPVYVVLVEKRSAGRWLAVPFSRFSTPATDGELLTSCAAVPLSVIQVWNAGEVDGGILDRGWVMGELPIGDFRPVLAHVRGGRPLPPSRRGAPVVHPLDPRRDYIEEERTLWFGLSSATFADEELGEPLPEAAETAHNP